ncbi:unnamed protein product, partial [Phaeothamnion confervicola]
RECKFLEVRHPFGRRGRNWRESEAGESTVCGVNGVGFGVGCCSSNDASGIGRGDSGSGNESGSEGCSHTAELATDCMMPRGNTGAIGAERVRTRLPALWESLASLDLSGCPFTTHFSPFFAPTFFCG